MERFSSCIDYVIGESIYDIEVTEIDYANGEIVGFTYDDKGFFETFTALFGDTGFYDVRA